MVGMYKKYNGVTSLYFFRFQCKMDVGHLELPPGKVFVVKNIVP